MRKESSRGPFSKRKEYANDYQKDASGKYVYIGVLYKYSEESGKSRRRALAEMWSLCLIAFAAIIACGLIRVPGMSGCAYVLLPYALALITVGSVFLAVINITISGNPMERYDYDMSVPKLPRRTVAAAVCAAVTAVGEIVYLIINGLEGDSAAIAILFIVLVCIAAASVIVIKRLMSGIKWENRE